MANNSEKHNMDLKAQSASGNCLVETENCKPDSDSSMHRKSTGRRNKRILYDREFLIKCFHNPASARKPSGFPIPHLDCTLASSKVKRMPLSTTPTYAPLKRKEEGGKRDRETEDNISLRPHSGNFSGGCGPNLTSPSHVTTSSAFSRIHTHEEPSKGYDRDYHRNNFRYGRRDINERNRLDRDQDRDHRDRGNRDRMSGNSHRNSNSWSNDGLDSSDWSRRRNGAHFPRDRDYNVNSGKRYSNDRDRGGREEEQEPEWFSGGPSSQHETIELRGFLDDERRDKSDDKRKELKRENSAQNGGGGSSGESARVDPICESESPMDLSIEKILKLDHIPGILSNDFNESEEPSGSSRFSQFFKRNSATPDPGLGRVAQVDHQENYSSNEDKSKAVHEMGELLRSMLIKKSAPVEPTAEPKPKETTKPATKDDVDAFKKLVTPLLEKVLQGPGSQKKSQAHAEKPVNSDQGQQPNVMDIFKQPPQQKSQTVSAPEDSSRNNPLQDIFNNMINKQPLPPPGDMVPRMTPNQILQMIPPELQPLVLNLNVSQSDYMMLINIAKTNELNFRGVLNQFLLQQCPPHQHMVYAGILKLVICGAINIPGVVIQNPMSQQVMTTISQPMPNHRPSNPNFEKMPRPVEEGPKDMTKRSATPVSSITFTPTSVMRKMTADGNKSAPPSNPSGFVPVPTSGGLLPTPPTTTPVIMNSNNANLASLMSSMARPPPHMQFRPPPPMGYPSNPGFHPTMMPPNLQGQLMMPPQFQNIIHSQPVFNKSDDN